MTSSFFESLCVFLIILNTAIIGAETEHLATHGTSSPELTTAQFVLNIWYMVELFIRLVSERKHFFLGENRYWNWFDTGMVLISVVDIFIVEGSHNVQMGRAVRVIRLVRIIRTLRILRTLRYLREFRKMVFAMASSLPTLLWSLVMLIFVMYLFAVGLTQGAANYQYEHPHTTLSLTLEDLYGNLPATLFTLYLAVTAGLSWGDAARPLLEVHWGYCALFIAFMSIALFGALNIITAVFVESAMHSAQDSRELLTEEKTRQKDVFVGHLKKIFVEIDEDSSGTLSEDELLTYLKDHAALRSYFDALDINASDARRLFRLLDADDSGNVDVEEFCDGCMHLKGEASSFDVNCIIYEHRRMQRWFGKFMSFVEDELRRIMEDNRGMREELWHAMHAEVPSKPRDPPSDDAEVQAGSCPREARRPPPPRPAFGMPWSCPLESPRLPEPPRQNPQPPPTGP